MDVVIEPARSKGDPELPDSGLILINPGEAEHCSRLSKGLDLKRHFLFNSKLYCSAAPERSLFWAGPMVGAPMAAMSLEKLIALGGKRFIVYGWCGSLQQNLRVGDLLLPTWAESEEGVTPHYPTNQRPCSSEPLRRKLADHLAGLDINTVSGPVWTTDAVYRETRQKVTTYAAEGILGVEMEFAALATVAAFRNVELAAVLMVSDELWRDQWTPGFTSKAFRQKNRLITESLLQNCHNF